MTVDISKHNGYVASTPKGVVVVKHQSAVALFTDNIAITNHTAYVAMFLNSGLKIASHTAYLVAFPPPPSLGGTKRRVVNVMTG